MNIIHISSEMGPFLKAGGLADVLQGLTREQIRQNHRVTVCLPFFASASKMGFKPLKTTLQLPWENSLIPHFIWKKHYQGMELVLFQSSIKNAYFPKKQLYGYANDPLRYIYFSYLCYYYLLAYQILADIIHLHEWTTALTGYLLKQSHLKSVPVVFTIHNLSHQGTFLFSKLTHLNMPNSFKSLAQDTKYPRKGNLLKVAIQTADFLTTVSPAYAGEIQTKYYGEGLHSLLRKHHKHLQGILNGIDWQYWNPQKDKLIAHRLSSSSSKLLIDQFKQKNRIYLEKFLDLPSLQAPLIGCVTRLVPQKGVKFLIKMLAYADKHKIPFVLLGKSPIKTIAKQFEQLQITYKNTPYVKIILENDEQLAHQIFAASDLFLIPSLFEPCGLTQMIAMRYGAIPLVRQTGGLQDTVIEKYNGFVFKKPCISEFINCLKRAINMYYNDTITWNHIRKTGVSSDFSWKQSAKAYEKVYRQLKKSDL